MKTFIVVDSKLMAYTATYQRKAPLVCTLDSIESCIEYMVKTCIIEEDYEVLMGFDFGKSRYRKELLKSYKGHRTEGLKDKPKAEQEAYDAFQSDYRNLLPEMVKALGVRVVGVQGVEFDDLGSIIAHRYHEKYNVILLTEDHDFLQLPLELGNVQQFFPKSYRLIDYNEAVAIEGVTDRAEFLVKKSILGDSGDSIKGLFKCGKECFDKWFKDLRGLGLPLDKWKELFVALAHSKKAYKIHPVYVKEEGITSYEELFDLNVKLGTTMQDFSYLSEEELDELNACFKVPLSYNKEAFNRLTSSQAVPAVNDFGDALEISCFPFIRGNKNERN